MSSSSESQVQPPPTQGRPPADLESQITALLSSLPSTFPALDRPLPSNPASHIDHTLLSPSASSQEIAIATEEAVQLGAKTVCVASCHVKLVAALLLQGQPAGASPPTTTTTVAASLPLPICTIGFPHGNSSSYAKVQETRRAIWDGAAEVDMVQNLGLVKEARWAELWNDIRGVVDAAAEGQGRVTVKVILETAALTTEEIAASTLICCLAGANYVKTSTGFSPSGGATTAAIRLMHHIASPYGVKVKASGGIRTWSAFQQMWQSGADRVGLSGTRAVLEGGSRDGHGQDSAGAGGEY